MNMFQDWPEPIVRVQSLSQSNLKAIPNRYVKPLSQRPNLPSQNHHNKHNPVTAAIPIIDLGGLYTNDITLHAKTLDEISKACKEWGFFQVVNHGMSPQLMDRAKETWRDFFHLPMELKNMHANSPKTYEGYGSRLGVEKGAILDWSDYYYLHYCPLSLKDYTKWPSLFLHRREILEDYCKEMVKLCENLMSILSRNLGLQEDILQNAFGGKEESGGCLRVNYYPKCPQPELTLGLSPHSDPGGLTILLPDEQVAGLQVRGCDDAWITVEPAPHALIVNIGDQIQMLTNSIYKSIEHRVIVSPAKERLSLAFFYNPKGNIPIEPLKELVTEDSPALYSSTTYDQYRQFMRTQGPRSFSEDGNNSTLQKRQRTSRDTKGEKKRTATLHDLDAIECPLCFDPLTIPIFQCDNGHIACFTCLHKLKQKCATCSLKTRSRNRAMERVLELLRVPCPNVELGCSEIISFSETSTHLEICAFTQRACPFSSCDFVCFNKDLYEHSIAKHCESSYMFECGKPVFIYPMSGKRVILKEQTTEGEGEIVIVECFDTPQGRIFYASCIGPGEEELSYTFKLFSSCSDRLWFESDLERVLEVSDEPPDEHFMLVPSCMCPDYKFYICINRQLKRMMNKLLHH